MEENVRKVFYFLNEKGQAPFESWLFGLKDPAMRMRIMSRIRRLESGNFGDCKSVGQGVNELRLFFGPGYRVYFGEDGNQLVVLLCGGDKKSQSKDIATAQFYWRDYLCQKGKK